MIRVLTLFDLFISRYYVSLNIKISIKDQKRDDLFKINANIFKVIMETLSLRLKNDPIYIVVGNPVNSLTVVCAETLKKTGRYHANKLFGLNELDVMRYIILNIYNFKCQ